jgi:hypothetical protein
VLYHWVKTPVLLRGRIKGRMLKRQRKHFNSFPSSKSPHVEKLTDNTRGYEEELYLNFSQ